MVPEVPALFREIAKSLSAEGLKPAAAACNRLLDSIKKEGGNDSAHKKLVSALDAVPVDTMARVVAGLQPAAQRVLLGLSDNMEDAFLRARLVPELALKMLEAANVGPEQLLGAMYGPVLDYSSDDEDAEAAEGLASMILTRADGGASGGKAAVKGKAAAKGKGGAKDKSESQGPQEEEGGGEDEPWFCGAARLGHLGVLRKAVAAAATKPSQEQLAAALRAAVLCGRRDAYRLLLDECGAPADAVDIARDLMAVATGSTGCSSAAASGAAGGVAPAAAALRWRRLQQDRVAQAVQLLVAVARERGQLSQVGPELILSALAAAAQALQPEAVRALAATAHGAVAAGGGDGEEAVAGAATALLWELVCGGAGAGQPLGMRGGIDDDSAAKAAAGGGAEDGDEEDQGPGEDGEMPEDAALSPQFATYKALVAAGGARVRLSPAQLRELQARPGAAAALAALPGDELVRVAAAGGGAGGGTAAGDTQPLEAAAGKGAEPWASDVASVAALAGLREAGGGKEGPAAAAAAAAIAAASTELSWAEVPLLQSPAAAPQAAAAAAPAAKKRKTDTAEAAALAAGVEVEPADGVHVLLAAAHVGNAAACLFLLTGDGDDEERDLDEDEDEEPEEEEEEEKEKQRGRALPEEARPRPGEVVQAVQVAARRGGGGAASGCWRLVDMLVGRLLCQVMMDQIMQVTGGGAGGGDGGGSDDDASDGEGKKRRRGAEAAGGSGSGSSVAEMIASNPNLKLLCHVVSGDGASAGDIMAGRAGDDDDDDAGEEREEGDKEKEKEEEEEAAAADGMPASSYWVARALQLAASRGDVGRVVELMAGIEVRCRQEREQQQQQKEGKEGAGGEATLTWGQAVLGRGVLAAMRTAVGALAGARRLRVPEERRVRLLGGRKVVQVLAHASGRQPAAAVAEGVAEVRAAVAAAHAELHYACKAARERGSKSTAAAASSAAGADGSSTVQLCGFRWGAVAPAVREAIEEARSEAVGGGGVGGEEADGLWESWESSEEAEEYGDEEAEEESDEEMEMGEGESGSGSGLSGEESDGEDDE